MSTATPTREIRWISNPACVAPYLYVQAVVWKRVNLLGQTTTEWVVDFRWMWTRGLLDRPTTHAISCGSDELLAMRLAAAVAVGLIHTDAVVTRDVDGATYVSAKCAVNGRYLAADLRKLGTWDGQRLVSYQRRAR